MIGVAARKESTTEFILSTAASDFLKSLHSEFNSERLRLLQARKEREHQFAAGEDFDFLEETKPIRESQWTVAPLPKDLVDRCVEITGPAEPKMIINALNSGARAFMADFEDSLSPTWMNIIEGQRALHDAVRRSLTWEQADGKVYRLKDRLATLIVRPRGWHLEEKHFNHVPSMSASLFDFGLYLFHNAHELLARGSGPYFYLPKMESHQEAALWAKVFAFAETALKIPKGSIRATVLIETLPAAFEMDEILYELREYICGLNAGRWDYLFSCIKKYRHRRDFRVPDRSQLTMTTPFMQAYANLLVRTCHHRGAQAMGGMAAYIPSRRDLKINDEALLKVRADKSREGQQGFDGTWVAHPDLVPLATEVFRDVLKNSPNQIHRLREDVKVSAKDLVNFSIEAKEITEAGVRNNISVSLQYLHEWLRGTGAVAINYLMEDAATAEISRSQLWLWLRQNAILSNGQAFTPTVYEALKADELKKLSSLGNLSQAAEVLDSLVLKKDFSEFLTLTAYSLLE